MKAHERHQLKQNEFVETALKMGEIVQNNRGLVAVLTTVGVIIAAIGGGWYYWSSHRANEAGALLGVAMATAQAPVTPAPSLPGATQTPGTYPTDQARAEAAIKAFGAVSAAYPGTDAAIAATYQSASELLALGRTSDAQAAFQQVAASGSSFYAPLARLGEAEILMATGKYDEAIRIYTEMAAARDTALPVDGLLIELARAAQKAGKTQDARAAFKRVVDEFPTSGYLAEAQQQLAALN
jgi:TolA-binding protein